MDDLFDDSTIIMEVLLDVRGNTEHIIELLEEDQDGEEEEMDT